MLPVSRQKGDGPHHVRRLGSGLILWLVLGAGGCDRAPPHSEPPEFPSSNGAAPEAGASGPAAFFTDRAEALGLDFVHFNGMSGELYYCEMVGPGGALFDYDGDGDLDVYLVQGNMLGPGKTLEDAIFPPTGSLPLRDRLYRNDLVETGRLRFSDVTDRSGLVSEGYGMGVAAGDYDNDGDLDLYVTNFGPNRMFRPLAASEPEP